MAKKKDSRVLVVEDDESILALIRQILEREGYAVKTVMNADEAMEQAESFKPQLALVDLKLPGDDGITLAKRLKEHNSGLQILMVSGYGTPDRIDEAWAAGIERFIMKPFKTKDLLLAVSQRLPLEV